MRSICLAACLLTFVAFIATVRADEYTKWVKDEKTKTYSCEYSYKTTDNKASTQKAVIFYADPDRKDWAYFYNTKNEPWARCATPTNKDYNANAMYWQKLDTGKDKYSDYATKNYCPAPGDGKAPIATLPLPPK